MANDINTITLVGRLAKDPQLRSLPSGMSVCDLRLAFTTSRKTGGEWQNESNFIDVAVWGGQGEAAARNLTTGRRVGITGRLEHRQWKDSNGSNRERYSITADRLQYLDAKSEGQATPAPAEAESIPY